ncbi:hypothetical protein L1987_89023 [Smallanthus sonchifolius]|nr:hypothetical protein L1987_89801 [Smallanthus sonchifolius]KAI3664501.1 hypothetical protein L1987_89739 [Smallanthus sonchifolius]KAI3666085.1 hypothetical protein L1987_89422 [Smallanthus sonchifolius]KAI3666258.1 hypothetical protein L1987_89244 [Smallanthus sonchifolius]KAI3666464.1 hypothetical protein L1987_89023 [Smallanthus sonchifolius]
MAKEDCLSKALLFFTQRGNAPASQCGGEHAVLYDQWPPSRIGVRKLPEKRQGAPWIELDELQHFCECYSDLSGLILCPVLGSITPLFIPNSRIRPIRLIGLCASLITFLYSPVLRIQFDPSTAKSQFVESLRWLPYENIHFYLGIDGISLFFVILTTFLIPICILVGWSGMRSYGKEYITASLIREFLMIAVFRMLDPLLFYVLPESVLIPMLCGAEHLIFAGINFPLQGPCAVNPLRAVNSEERLLAAGGDISLALQKNAGRVELGRGFENRVGSWVWGSRQRKIKAAYQLFLYTLLGSVFMLLAILLILFQTGTTDLQILLTTEFSERRQIFLWIAFFASFAVKVPMVPVHIWLPEAHVEAPTAGSVILAGILLKLGTYGFLRFSIPMFPEATLCFTPFIYTLSAIAIIYTSLTTLRQIDLKKIIAYSSVAHMNLVTIGAFQRNSLVATLAALGMILGAAYSLWLYNRVVSGNLKPDFLHKFSDLNGREVFIFIPFLVGVVWMGVYPKVFPDCMHTSRFCPWALIGAASKHLYSPRDPVPPLQHFMAWYRRRRKYYLPHDANETESPGGTLSCVLRGTPTYNYTLSFTLHSSSSKTRIWLLTRRGARERSPYDFFFYGVGVRDQIRWLLPVPPMGSR